MVKERLVEKREEIGLDDGCKILYMLDFVGRIRWGCKDKNPGQACET